MKNKKLQMKFTARIQYTVLEKNFRKFNRLIIKFLNTWRRIILLGLFTIKLFYYKTYIHLNTVDL